MMGITCNMEKLFSLGGSSANIMCLRLASSEVDGMQIVVSYLLLEEPADASVFSKALLQTGLQSLFCYYLGRGSTYWCHH